MTNSSGMAVPMPSGVIVERSGGELFITRRWICGKFIVFAAFGAIGIAAEMAFVYHMLVGFPSLDPPPEEGVPTWLLIGIFTLAFVQFYLSLAVLINKTYVRLGKNKLSVRHGPVPWPGSQTIPTQTIQQLYCTKEEQEMFGLKIGGGGRAGMGGASSMYVVNALFNSGRKIKLIKLVMVREQAQFIEQEIENHLGIEDERVRVRGEL